MRDPGIGAPLERLRSSDAQLLGDREFVRALAGAAIGILNDDVKTADHRVGRHRDVRGQLGTAL